MSRYDRFKDAPWFTQGVKPMVMVGGVGGIGSWLSMMLARAGFQVIAFDFDEIEGHNLGGQLYGNKHIGMKKVQALNSVIQEFADRDNFIGNDQKVDKNTLTNTYVFSAFDNMEARQEMFTKWREMNEGNKDAIFIDGRLLAEQLQIFCIKGDDLVAIEKYVKEHLFDDGEVEELSCTMKQTSHCAAMIASHMTSFFTNHITNINTAGGRRVPFYWEYIAPIDFLISE